jgi:PAS domain S-box-containing protein
MAIVPLTNGNSLHGVLTIASFSTKQWDDELVPLLAVFGDIIHDAIQRKHAMQAMAESENRFRLVSDEAPMFIWMSDSVGMCTYVNRAWTDFCGIKLAGQIEKGWQQLVHPEDQEECIALFNDAHRSQDNFHAEYRVKRRDGMYRWILDMGVPRFDGSGRFIGLIGSAVDITDRRHAEKLIRDFSGRLINAQEAERLRIARELHDDVGQQLALLAIELDKLRERVTPQGVVSINKLSEQTDNIARSIRQVSHGLHSASLEALSIESALNSLCRDFGETDLTLSFSGNGNFYGVPNHIKLCLYRVAQTALQNVVKHSRARNARIELTSKDEMLLLVVADDGIGFDPLHASGTGLGLQSIRERLRSHGGSLRISSSPNTGTRIEAQISRRARPIGPDSLAA